MSAQTFGAIPVPPPSPLQEICEELLEGRGSLEQLKSTIGETRKSLLEMEKDFEQVTRGMTPEILQASREGIKDASNAFQEYLEALKKIEQYLQGQEASILTSGVEMLKRSSLHLEQAFFFVRQSGLAAMGPTRVPGINLVIQTAERLSAGEAVQALLRDQVEREVMAVRETRRQIEEEAQPYGVQDLASSYDLYEDGLQMVSEAAATGNLELLRKSVLALTRAGHSLVETTTAFDLQRLTLSPTASRQVNLVINLARDLLAGKTDSRMFWKALAALRADLERMKFQCDTLLRSPASSGTLDEERKRVSPLLEEYEAAITSLYSFFETEDPATLESACLKVQELTGQLEELWKGFEDLAEKEVRVRCIRCGHYSSRERKTCEKCSAILPIPVEEERSGVNIEEGGVLRPSWEGREVNMTHHIHTLFEAARQAAEDQISQEEFARTVSWMENLVLEARKFAFPPPSVTPEGEPGTEAFQEEEQQLLKLKGALEAASQEYQEGLQEILTGLSFFQQFLSGGDKGNLQSGMQVIWQGVGKLQKVQEITQFK